jgi:hypothetical protein
VTWRYKQGAWLDILFVVIVPIRAYQAGVRVAGRKKGVGNPGLLKQFDSPMSLLQSKDFRRLFCSTRLIPRAEIHKVAE